MKPVAPNLPAHYDDARRHWLQLAALRWSPPNTEGRWNEPLVTWCYALLAQWRPGDLAAAIAQNPCHAVIKGGAVVYEATPIEIRRPRA